MYLIELIIKKLTKKQEIDSFDPISYSIDSEDESCDHIFMPIDSTNEILSCTKCGILVNRSKLKNKNFFCPKQTLICLLMVSWSSMDTSSFCCWLVH